MNEVTKSNIRLTQSFFVEPNCNCLHSDSFDVPKTETVIVDGYKPIVSVETRKRTYKLTIPVTIETDKKKNRKSYILANFCPICGIAYPNLE